MLRKKNDDGKDLYFTCEDDCFVTILNGNINSILEKMNLQNKILAEEVDMRKTVVTSYDKRISASLGYLKLNGSKELINALLQTGIGSRRTIGMGKFRIL